MLPLAPPPPGLLPPRASGSPPVRWKVPSSYVTAKSLKMTTMDSEELTQWLNSKFPSFQDLSQVSKTALKIKSIEWLKFDLKAGIWRRRAGTASAVLLGGP